jgi:hypothetical protein
MLHELHQLLDALKLRYVREAVEDVLREAQRVKPSYSQFLKDLLSRELQAGAPSPTGLRPAGLKITGPWANRCVARDASFILQNRRDPVGRHPHHLRERVCRQANVDTRIWHALRT